MEAPPLRTILVVASFLGIFAILVTTIPTEFMAEAREKREQDYPDYFESIDMTTFGETIVKNITEQWYSKTYELGGHDFQLIAYNDNGGKLIHKHYHWFWVLPVNHHPMEWIDVSGKRVDISIGEVRGINKEILDQSWDNDSNTAKFTLRCKHTTIIAFFGYNTSKYSKASEAWEAYELSILFAISMDEMSTGWNIWALVSGILFFDAPDIHIIINAIIAIPIWVSVAWLTFAFLIAVLKSLPFT